MSERLKALVALPDPPLAEGRAAGRVALAMLRGLAAHGVQVRSLAARAPWGMPGDPPEDMDVEVVEVGREPPGWRSRLRRLRRPVGELARSEFGERVRAEAQHADVLHLVEVDTAWCSEGADAPSALSLHYLVRRDRGLGAPWRREFRHVLESELAERRAIRRHRVLIAASPPIADELAARAPHAHVEIVPFCLDPEDYPTASLDGEPAAGIIGTAEWPPTAGAIERLLADIWPAVRPLAPGGRLLIAGRGTASLRHPDGNPADVEVLGEVPSASGFLRSLSVLVYPVPRGSGVKVKVLEAIASGVPVVTTPAGAEGIDAGDGVIVETESRRLAEATAELLRDEGARRQRGAAARAAFLERYAPLPATEPLVSLYRRMAEASSS
jgi:glycosyltransferase involved in cell wall biosynthesis